MKARLLIIFVLVTIVSIATAQTKTLIPAGINGKSGYIDQDGNWAIEPKYDLTASFISADGLGAVKINDRWGKIDNTGKKLFDNFNYYFTPNDLIPVSINGKWGYINTAGKMVIKPKFDDAYGFTDFSFLIVTMPMV